MDSENYQTNQINTTNNISNEIIDFSQINLSIPENIHGLPFEEQQKVFNYLMDLNHIQIKAYNIAKNHLGTSFNILKSNGFKEWNKNKST